MKKKSLEIFSPVEDKIAKGNRTIRTYTVVSLAHKCPGHVFPFMVGHYSVVHGRCSMLTQHRFCWLKSACPSLHSSESLTLSLVT